ncbi:MAG TPA: glutamate racemase [Bacteroidales bacterium]|nr:glutamate racemase [Bacteroidales bacterium]
MNKIKPIGVFDSGIGGLNILNSLYRLMPNENYLYVGDSLNAPYGEKTRNEIIELTKQHVEFLIGNNVKIVVIACNTATGAAIAELRDIYQDIDFVGLEPAVKPACLMTRTGNIGVLATEGTFKAKHFITTSEKYNTYVNIHTQVGYGLVSLAEKNRIYSQESKELLYKYLEPLVKNNIDYLVLGCTHYPFFSEIIAEICGNSVRILDSGEAVAKRTKDLLMTRKLLNDGKTQGVINIFSTGDCSIFENIVANHCEFVASACNHLPKQTS